MKQAQVSQICQANDQFHINWKKTVIKPIIIGFAFGIGYYLANLFLKTDLMGDLLQQAKEVKIKKIAKLATSGK